MIRVHGLNGLNRVGMMTGIGLVRRKIVTRRTTVRFFIAVFPFNYSMKNTLKARDSDTFPRLRD